MSPEILIEVCCGSTDDAVEAERGGADRVELNSSLFFGGLTPSLGSVIEAKKRLSIPVIVMIRPRGGGFCYTEAEMEVMCHDARLAVEHGADGLVFGILTPEGSIDTDRCRQIVELIGSKEAVFHRAFDVTPEPLEALDKLVELGFKRILTSGQAPTVPEGAELIKELIDYAGDRMEILPGAGILAHNVRRRTNWSQTGSSLRIRAKIRLLGTKSTEHYLWRRASPTGRPIRHCRSKRHSINL